MNRKYAAAALAAVTLLVGGFLLSLDNDVEPPTAGSAATSPSAPAAPAINTPLATPATGELTLSRPVAALDAEAGVIRVELAVELRLPGASAPLAGTVTLTGAPRIDDSSKRFFLRDAQTGELQLPGLTNADRPRVQQALEEAASQFAREQPVYAPAETRLPSHPVRITLRP